MSVLSLLRWWFSFCGGWDCCDDRQDRRAAIGQKRNLTYLKRLPRSRHSTRNLLRRSLTNLFVDHVLPHLERPYLASQLIRIAIWGGIAALQSRVVQTKAFVEYLSGRQTSTIQVTVMPAK